MPKYFLDKRFLTKKTLIFFLFLRYIHVTRIVFNEKIVCKDHTAECTALLCSG